MNLRTLACAATATFMLAGVAVGQSDREQQRQAERQRERERDREKERERDRDRDWQQNRQSAQDLNLERASRVIGMQVETSDAERAGTIENIAIHPTTGKAIFVVVNPEGRANFGNQLKAVPFKALTFRDVNQPARMNIDRARFADAPPFDNNGWRTMNDANWKRTVYQHYNVTEDSSGQTSGQQQLVRASAVSEYRVQDRQQNQVGSIDDLMIDLNRGMVVYAVMNMQQQRDRDRDRDGNRMYALPWTAFSDVRENERILVLDFDRNRLREAPTFTRHQELSNSRTLERIYSFYGAQPDTVYGYVPADDDDTSTGGSGQVGGDTGNTGWEHRSEYNRLFDARSLDNIQGEVIAIERFNPRSGMSPGVQLRLRSGQNQTHTVHLGPAWYIERQDLNFRQGDNVRCVASRVQFNGQTVYIASEVRQGDNVLWLRDSEGNPRWSATFRVNELPRGNNEPRGRAVGRDRDRD